MPRDRLPSAVWVSAGLRALAADGIPGTVVNRGEADSGTLILKLNLLGEGCRVLTESRDMEGRLGWFPPLGKEPVPEADADAYIARSLARDPDIWVVEVEDRQGRNPFGGREL